MSAQNEPVGRPLIRHGLRPCHLPPRAKAKGRRRRRPPRETVEAVPALHGTYSRRGAHCAPAGGHMGPPLRNFGPFLPVGADLRVRPKRTGRSPPHPALWATFPPGGRSGAPGSSRPTKGLLPCGGGAPVRTLGRKGETPRLSEQLNLRMPPSVALRSTAPPQGGSQGRARTVRPRAATWGRAYEILVRFCP